MVFRLRLLTVVGAAVRDGRYEIGLLGDLKNGGERCDRPSAGSYDPDERPALVRRMPASTPWSHGARTLPLIRQSAAYPENRVSATVDPRDPEIFTFRQHTVRANVPQYTAP
jgi:hypothetical protein